MKKIVDNAEELLQESRTFENDRVLNLEKSKNIAWRVCTIFIIFSFSLMIVIVLLMPLKEVKPYVISVDNNTGYTEIIPSLIDSSFTPDEALDRFWVGHYVMLREKYVYETLQQDYEQVQIYNNDNVNRLYIDSFEKAESPNKIYGDSFLIIPKILSITLNETGGETPTRTAMVRVELERKNLLTKQIMRKRLFITISYDYVPNINLSSDGRILNPLGFLISSYLPEIEMAEK